MSFIEILAHSTAIIEYITSNKSIALLITVAIILSLWHTTTRWRMALLVFLGILTAITGAMSHWPCSQYPDAVNYFIKKSQQLDSILCSTPPPPPPPPTNLKLEMRTHASNNLHQNGPIRLIHLNQVMYYGLTFSPNHAGYVVILDIDANGKVTQVFPNANINPSVNLFFVSYGKEIIIPDDNMRFKLRAKEPIGKSKTIAILIEHAEFDTKYLMNLLDNGQPIETTHNPAQQMNRIQARIDQTLQERAPKNSSIQWSIASYDYEIVP